MSKWEGRECEENHENGILPFETYWSSHEERIFGSCNGETEEEEKQYYGRASVKRRHEASEGSVRVMEELLLLD